jgi:hypothetical protein
VHLAVIFLTAVVVMDEEMTGVTIVMTMIDAATIEIMTEMDTETREMIVGILIMIVEEGMVLANRFILQEEEEGMTTATVIRILVVIEVVVEIELSPIQVGEADKVVDGRMAMATEAIIKVVGILREEATTRILLQILQLGKLHRNSQQLQKRRVNCSRSMARIRQ